MKRVCALAVALSAAVPCAVPGAAAQDSASAQAPAAAEPTAATRAAALELLRAMDVAATLDASINTMMEIQMQSNPALRSVEGVMREFFRRHMSWEALEAGYVDIYARAFTEDELRQLTEFYRSPAGRKLTRAMPRLMREGAALGQRAVEEHSDELRQMILEHLSTRTREAAPPNAPGRPNPPARPNRPGQPNPPTQPGRP